MSVTELRQLVEGPSRGQRLWGRIHHAATYVAKRAAPVGRAAARPVLRHLADHGYSILGFGFIDIAAFVHSPFTGFLVTGLSFLVFEWKVSE